MFEIFFCLFSFSLGLALSFLFLRLKFRLEKENRLKELQEENLKTKHKLDLEEKEREYLTRNLEESKKQQTDLQEELNQQKEFYEKKLETEKTESKKLQIELEKEKTRLEEELNQINSKSTELQTEKKNLQESLIRQEQKQVNLEKNLKEFLAKELENSRLKLQDNSTQKLDFSIEKISNFNKEKLSDVLNPVKEKLSSFEASIQNFQDKNIKETTELKISLEEKIKRLNELNQQISKDAQGLTKALTADKKKQGNWGELILETLLEYSGLQKGVNYFAQKKISEKETNKDLIPDFIVNLPDQKKIIIDSKVSLESYRKYINSEEKEEQEKFLKEHIRAIREHIKSLGIKNYEKLSTLEEENRKISTIKFVLMFLPIEPAFIEAVQSEPDLFREAYKKNIILISTSTLFPVLKIVNELWDQEKQSKNSQKIAEEATKIYEKCCNLLESFGEIGKNLTRLTNSYEKSAKRLSEGNGNLIDSCRKLEELGINSKKSIESSVPLPLLKTLQIQTSE